MTATIGHNGIAAGHLRSFVERIRRLRDEIKNLNADISDIYKEAHAMGFDKKALRATVGRAEKVESDPSGQAERDEIEAIYWEAYQFGTPSATRARTEDEDER